MNEACIYYDLEEVSSDDVELARSRAPGAQEFTACGTNWPEQLAGSRPEQVVSPRDFAYQEELMGWTNRLFAALERSPVAPILASPDGVSLLEIARYRFLFEFADVEQRWRALNEMTYQGTKEILWIAPRSRLRSLARLAAGDAPIRLQFHSAAKSPKNRLPVYQFARSLARRLFDRLVDHTTRVLHRPSAPTSGASVVFVEYFPNSAKVLLPVANALRKNHGVEVVWLAARLPVKRLLDQHGVSSVSLRQLSPIAHRKRKRLEPAECGELRVALEGVADELYCGTGRYMGKEYLLPAIYDHLVASLDEAIFWLDAFSEAFGQLRPQCVVSTTYSSIVGRAAAVAGRAIDASTVFVQHGLFPDCRFFAHFCHNLLLVWGEANRRTIVDSGIDGVRVRVVGATVFDDLARRFAQNAPSRSPAPGGALRIAFMPSRTAGTVVNLSAAERCIATVLEAIERLSNACLTVKVHPGDHTGVVERAVRNRPRSCIASGVSSLDLIGASDIVIVVASTTGLEACMADKPLIVLRVPGVSDPVPYDAYGAAFEIAVDSPNASKELAALIDRLSRSPTNGAELAEGRRRLIHDMLNGGVGNAAELVARAITESIRTNAAPAQVLDPAN